MRLPDWKEMASKNGSRSLAKRVTLAVQGNLVKLLLLLVHIIFLVTDLMLVLDCSEWSDQVHESEAWRRGEG